MLTWTHVATAVGYEQVIDYLGSPAWQSALTANCAHFAILQFLPQIVPVAPRSKVTSQVHCCACFAYIAVVRHRQVLCWDLRLLFRRMHSASCVPQPASEHIISCTHCRRRDFGECCHTLLGYPDRSPVPVLQLSAAAIYAATLRQGRSSQMRLIHS
jgi:hypothetical protein